VYFRRKTSAGRAYLQIVESRRDGDQVRQQVIATLGRFDELQASGQLERLVRSGARFGKRGKTRGGMILRFPGGRESDSFWECRGPGILTVCRTPS
jgi:hypothetical protein